MICEGLCFHTDWVCGTCYVIYPELQHPFALWPAWARELKRMHHNERNYELRAFADQGDGYSAVWQYDLATVGERNDDMC